MFIKWNHVDENNRAPNPITVTIHHDIDLYIMYGKLTSSWFFYSLEKKMAKCKTQIETSELP